MTPLLVNKYSISTKHPYKIPPILFVDMLYILRKCCESHRFKSTQARQTSANEYYITS